MAIVPIVIALAGWVVYKKVDADQNDKKMEDDKVWKRFEPDLDHTYKTFKKHDAQGEFAQAIKALTQHIALFNERGSVAPADKKYLDRMLNNLIFRSQQSAMVLSREFKATAQNLQDDPTALSVAHYEYIEKLKVVLPQDDAFLRKEVEHWERLNPKISLWD